MQSGIYAIRDIVADTIIGGLQLHKHDASAIRTFGDIASDPQTQIHKHPKDFELVCLGWLDLETNTIDAANPNHVIITGATWLAAQNPDLSLVKEA